MKMEGPHKDSKATVCVCVCICPFLFSTTNHPIYFPLSGRIACLDEQLFGCKLFSVILS